MTLAYTYQMESKFGGEISDAKFLVEFVSERKAQTEKRILRPAFWKEEIWKKFYAEQIVAAHALLKHYPISTILRALRHPKMTWVYSLRSPQLKPYLTEIDYQEKQKIKLEESKQDIQALPIEQPKIVAPRTQQNKQTKLNKLRELDE